MIRYLRNPGEKGGRQVKYQALNYVIMGNDLFRRAYDGMTLQCIGQDEQMKVIAEVHEGICGDHQAKEKMRWMVSRYVHF